MKIQWLFFDVGGVLTDERRFWGWVYTHAEAIIRKYDPSTTPEKLKEVRRIASGMDGKLSENIFRVLLQGDALRAALEEWKEARKRGPTHADLQDIRPNARAIVKALSQRYSLGIIANQHTEMKEKLADAGVLEYFKHKQISEEYGVAKPNPKYFEMVMRDVGTSPAQSAIVDDNLERSLIPAKKLGMTTIWYKLEERVPPAGVVDFTIASLAGLSDFFS